MACVRTYEMIRCFPAVHERTCQHDKVARRDSDPWHRAGLDVPCSRHRAPSIQRHHARSSQNWTGAMIITDPAAHDHPRHVWPSPGAVDATRPEHPPPGKRPAVHLTSIRRSRTGNGEQPTRHAARHQTKRDTAAGDAASMSRPTGALTPNEQRARVAAVRGFVRAREEQFDAATKRLRGGGNARSTARSCDDTALLGSSKRRATGGDRRIRTRRP